MNNRHNFSSNKTIIQRIKTINERPDLIVQLVSLSLIFCVTVLSNLALIIVIFYSYLSKKRQYMSNKAQCRSNYYLRCKNKPGKQVLENLLFYLKFF